MPSKNRITVNLSDNEFAALEEIAEQSKVSKSWVGRHAICSFLEQSQANEAQLPLPLKATNSAGAQ